MPLNFFYTMLQKVKNDQKLKSRGPAEYTNMSTERKLKVLQTNSAQSSVVDTEESRHNHNERTYGIYSSLFRAKASGGHSKAREIRDAQFLQKFTRFALIVVTLARPRVCKCPPPQIPVSKSPF